MKPELGNYFDSGRSRSGFRPRLADFASGIDFIQIGALLCLIGTGLLFIYVQIVKVWSRRGPTDTTAMEESTSSAMRLR